MTYRGTVGEFEFLLENVAGFDRVAATDRFAEATPETVSAVLSEAGRFCEQVMAPLRREGDLHPARLENGVVRTSPGFPEAWGKLVEGGWIGICGNPEHGGMGLPFALGVAVNEMQSASNLALELLPLMTQGQIRALDAHASSEIKALYLPKLTTGQWGGTMNLTEPQAGSDVGSLATRAEPDGEGAFKLTGQKIFISWADNDFTENTCHLVLARLPDASPGTAGVSLFLVPKRLPTAEGEPGAANSLRVASLEHKLGLHGSPTAVMEYDGATGWLVGEPHGGMAAMFTMMNYVRVGVGAQGVGIAEGAYQHALAHALERKQGRSRIPDPTGTIMDHADVRRMLATMKADIFAARALLLDCAVAIDMQDATGDESWASRAALLTPIAKAFGTEVGIESAQAGIQVFGGMGFVEETGAAQFLRDVRVTSIYEGTNGIQSMDLVGRKLADGGAAASRILDEIEEFASATASADSEGPEIAVALADVADLVGRSAKALREATGWLAGQTDLNERFAGAAPYLRAFARVLGGHYHLKAARAAPGGPREALARLYARRVLPEHASLIEQVRAGASDLYALGADEFATA